MPLSTKHGTKNLAPLAPWPLHCYLSKLGGGVVAYKDRALPPPPPGACLRLLGTSMGGGGSTPSLSFCRPPCMLRVRWGDDADRAC